VYFTRKRRYAIYLQAVADHQGLFTFYDIGYPASAHDVKVFRNSKFYLYRNQLFEEQDTRFLLLLLHHLKIQQIELDKENLIKNIVKDV
jgi:hypothetical protein